MTRKTLRRFEVRLFICSTPQAKYYLGKLAQCLTSIREKAHKLETEHNMSVMQISTSQQQRGELPFALGVLTLGHDSLRQSCLVSFLVDSGSQINIMSLEHLQQMGINKKNIRPVLNDYTIKSSTETKTPRLSRR